MASASFNGVFGPSTDEPGAHALIGIPQDRASSFRAGAHLGPAAIREMAASLNPCTERGTDLARLNAVDQGDLSLSRDADSTRSQIASTVARAMNDGTMPIVLGGDHSVTVPSFNAALERYPDVQMLYLDAHPDLYTEFGGDPFSHACVVARILDMDGMTGDRITQAGVRAWTPEQREIADQHGIKTFSVGEIAPFRYETSKPVYLSLDIDVLDPAFAPGVGNPVPGGLSSRALIDLVQGLDVHIVGMDLVEVNPLLDRANVTSVAGARLVLEALGTMAQHRGAA
ncbi:MAG: agmatinase [Candidatus Bipolaricaulia bacterium]